MQTDDDVLGKAYDARIMRRLLRYLWPYRGSVLVAFVALLIGSGLQLVPPWLTRRVIDVAIPSGDADGLVWIAALYLATLAGEFGLEYIETWTLQLTGQRIMFDLRTALYEHLHRLDIRFFDRNPVGRLMTRVTTDVDALNELFTSGIVTVFGDVFTLVGIAAMMFALDWRLALVALSVLPLVALIAQWFRHHARESYREVRLWIARINAFLNEHISGMTTVQLFRQETATYQRFDVIDAAHRDANVRSIFYYAVFYPAIELVGALAVGLLLWYGGGRVMQEAVSLGTLVAFIQYSQRFFRPISDLSEKFNLLQGAMAASERIFGLLDTPPNIEREAIAVDASPVPAAASSPRSSSRAPGIVFDHVWFAYDGEDHVLRDVSFTIAAGERVGIVGATGAGKSTILNLLLRFYDVSRGRITVDGIDIREWPVAELRALFALVLQDVHLFAGTVRSNVRLGNATITDAAIDEALRAVHADTFVAALPGGADAPVAERGATFSVGQKQLLSFARALASDRPILMLDEATSSVDTHTEWQIRDALTTVMQARTTIAIAHRLSTIQDMDRILVLHKGELRESGSHQELLAMRGLYRQLFELQYAER